MAETSVSNGEGRKHLFLIDGSGYIFRAYHALPPMTRPDGTPVNAVYGFTSMLTKLVEDSDADYLAVIFDTARKTFRSEIYSDYKAHRPPPPDDLIPQFALIRESVEAFGLPQSEMEGYEADDLIATYAKQAAAVGHRVTIVSSDKDLMQLIDDNISMQDPMKGTAISYAEVQKKFGVNPDKVIDVQSLAGDSADNVPGVPGIGVKRAESLFNEHGYSWKTAVKAFTDKGLTEEDALVNARLARILTDDDYDFDKLQPKLWSPASDYRVDDGSRPKAKAV